MTDNMMLSEKIAEQILRMITVEKKFNVGDKLPNENDLSEQLGVSRTTLREAVKILIAHDILEIRRGKGTFVINAVSIDEMDKKDETDSLIVNPMDFFELRMMIEPTMAYYAAKRATEEDIEELIEINDKINSLSDDKDAVAEYNYNFHNAIARATKNEFIISIIPIIYSGIYKTNLFRDEYNETANYYRKNDHEMILNFIKNRDYEGADAAMRMHIIHAISILKGESDKEI